MQANKTMLRLLQAQRIEMDPIDTDDSFPIWQKSDRKGRLYWGITDFWELDKRGVPENADLSQLEWDGNEVFLDTYSKAEIARILTKGIGIMKAWKQHLEQRCPETVFLILASYDNGDALVNRADYPDGFYSLTLRFWAVRNGNAIVNLTGFDEWEQPALLDICNESAIPVSENALYPSDNLGFEV